MYLTFVSTFLQVHFGVNSGATRFAIEHQAVNEATFRCPDEMGWKPQVRIVGYSCEVSCPHMDFYLDILNTISLNFPRFMFCRRSPLFLQMAEFHTHDR